MGRAKSTLLENLPNINWKRISMERVWRARLRCCSKRKTHSHWNCCSNYCLSYLQMIDRLCHDHLNHHWLNQRLIHHCYLR